MRVTLGGAEVDLLHRQEVLDRILEALSTPDACPLFVASANLDHVHHFGIDSGREGMLDGRTGAGEWLVLLDGMPLVWKARGMTGQHWDQLAGSDLLPQVLALAARARARVGFLGGTDGQHRALATVLTTRFPSLDIAGYWAPDREVVDDHLSSAVVAEEIAAAHVDLLVVGLGKPRQEEWILRHGAATGVHVAVAFGAAADFVAGTVYRAPKRMQRAGLEWLYRLSREPGRLARRYLIEGPSAAIRLVTQSHAEMSADPERSRAVPIVATPGLWRRRIGRVLAVGDALTITAASGLAYVLRDALGQAGVVQAFANEVAIALAVIPVWLAIFHYAGAYRPEVLNTGGDAFRRFVAGAFGGLLALGFISFAFNLSISRLYVLFLFTLVLGLGGMGRILLRRYLRSRRARGRLRQNVLIVGADNDAVTTVAAMLGDEMCGYTPVGFLADDWAVGEEPVPGIPIVGRPDRVLDHAYDHRAGLVIVSPVGVSPGTLQELTLALEGTPIDLAIAPSLFQVVTRRMTVESVANVPILHVDQIRLERGRATLKRLEDLLVAGTLFILSLPVVVVLMAAIRLDSSGPALFIQPRVGRDGRAINVLKLRTMVVGAETQQAELADRNEADGHFFKIRDDPRVTRVGRFLRRWSLDELPQLYNVLRGDMSMVGPRPPTPDEVEKYEPWHLRRLRIRPGITGAWQTGGRSEVGFDEAVRLDLFYIENWSLGYDIFLLGKTVLVVLGRRGAY